MGKKETLNTPKWEETEEITTSTPSWEDTEEVKKKVQPVSGGSGLKASGGKLSEQITESVSEVPSISSEESWADRTARLITENAPKSQKPIVSKVEAITEKVNENLLNSQINPVEKQMMFGGRNPLYEVQGQTSIENDKQTFEDAQGIDYWMVRGAKKGDRPFNYDTDAVLVSVGGNRPRQLPTDMRKVMDDYLKHIAINEPEKFKTLSMATDYKGAEVKEGADERGSSTFYINLAEGSKKVPSQINRFVQNGKIVGLSDEDEFNAIFEALQHQQNILYADYKRKLEGGAPQEEAYKDLVIASTAVSNMQNQIINDNKEFGTLLQREQQKQKTAEKRQQMADLEYEMYHKKNPLMANIYYGFGQPVKESLKGAMRDFYSIPSNLGVSDLSALASFGNQATAPDITPTQLQGSLWDEDGFHFEKTLNRVSKTGADMITLLAGSKGLGTLAKVGYKPALFGTSYVMTYNDYYDEARNSGLSPEQADSHAQRSAFVTSLLELVSPNINLTQGLKSELTEQTVKNLAKGYSWKDSFKEALKTYSKEIPQENVQEIMQLLGDKYQASVTNELSGREAMDTKITGGEIGETMFLTSVVTGIGNMRALKSPNTLQKSTIYQSVQNYNDMIDLMQKGVKKGEITKEQADVTIEGINEAKQIIDGLPQDIKLNSKQKMDLADVIYQKKKLSEQVENEYVDDIFKKQKEEEIKKQKAKLDTEALDIVNRYEVQQIAEKGKEEIKTEFEKQKKEGEQSAKEGKIAQKEYDNIVREYAKTLNEEQFVERMMEEDFGGEIPQTEARKYYKKQYQKLNTNDTQNITGVRGGVQEGQTTEQKEPVKEPSSEEVETGGILQGTPEEVTTAQVAPIEKLVPTEDLSTKDRDVIDGIKESIKKGETIEPIQVSEGEGGTFNIEDGHHRFVAYSEMGVKDIPIEVVEPTVSDTAPTEATAKKKWSDDIMNTLNKWDEDLGKFGKETAGMNIPVVIGRGAVKAMKATIQTAQTIDDIVKAGVDYIKNSKWYQNLSQEDRDVIDENLSTNAYDVIMQRGKSKEDLIKERAQHKGVQQGYKFGVAEGKEKGMEKGMKKGIKEGVREGRKQQKEKAQKESEERAPYKQANKTRKRIRKGVKNVFANEKQVIKDFLRINPNQVEDIEEYNQISSRIFDTVMGARAKGGKAERTDTISLEEIDEYTKRNEKAIKEPEIKEAHQKLIEMANRMGIENAENLSEQELIDEIQNAKEEQLQRANEEFSTIIEGKKKEVKETFEKSDDEGAPLKETLSEQAKESYETLMRVDPSQLSLKEKANYIDVLNNMAENGSLAGSGQVVIDQLVREGEKNIKKGFKKYKTGKPVAFYKDVDGIFRNMFKGYAEFRSHIPAMIKYISLNNVISGLVRAHTGLQRLWADTAKVNTKAEVLMENIEKIKAKYPQTRTPESMVKLGMAGAMIQTMGGTQTDVNKDFDMYKKLVDQSIQVRLASNDSVTRQRGKIEQQVFNDFFVRAQNKEDVMNALTEGEKKIIEAYQQVFDKEFNALNENSEIYYNETLPQVDGYLPMVWEQNQDFVEQTDKDVIDNIMASAFLNDIVNKRASGTTISRRRVNSIFNDKGEARRLLSFDFDYNMTKKYREALYQTNTAQWRMLADKSLKSKWFADSFGKKNADIIHRGFKESVKHQVGAYDYRDNFEKAVVQGANKLAQRAASVVLASPTAFIKQSISVLFGTGINLKGRYNLLFKQPSVDFDSNIFRYSNLPERIKTRAATKIESYVTDAEKAAFRKEYENYLINGLVGMGYSTKDAYKWVGENIDKISEKSLSFLVKGDMWAAKKSWMAYYAQYMMDNKGVKKIDWNTQIENPDLEASAYADQQVEQTQNVNQQALRGKMFRRTKSYFDILRGMYMAFSEFAANQQTRTRVAFRQMRKGALSGGGKEMIATGGRELASVVAENAFYGGVTMGIGIATTMGAQELFQALTGASDDETQELIPLDYKWMFKQSASKVGKDLLLGGMPSPIDHAGSLVLNEGIKAATGEEKDLLYTPSGNKDWASIVKEYGIYGSVLEKWSHAYDDGKAYLTGELPMLTQGGVGDKIEYGTYELSPRERNAFGLFFLMDIANLSGVNVQEVNAVINKTRRALQKDLKQEKLGRVFTIEMGKKGEDYQSVSGSRPKTKQTTRTTTRTR